MKILYVSDSAIPSTSPNSIHVMKMCQAFASLGHDVTLVGKNTTNCIPDIADLHSFYAVKKTFTLQIFPTTAFRGSGMYYNLSFLWRALVMTGDLIYTRSITAAFFLLLYNRNVVFEVHEPYEGKGARLRIMFSFILRHRRLTKLVVISDALKQYYVTQRKCDVGKILVAHDGADLFEESVPVIRDHEFKVGYIGSLLPGKGIEILVPLARECPAVKFHVVGGNSQQIEKFKGQAGGLSNLVFHGHKLQGELPRYLASFDAMIAPYSATVTVSEKTGANNLALWMSPLKIFEYMSAGKPIIASNLPVIREILKQNHNALLCDPGEISGWTEAVDLLRSRPEVCARLGRQASLDFSGNFTWRKRAELILESIGAN